MSETGHLDVPSTPSLFVVATPIGNLGDLSPRARAVLESVDRIAAEDTRNTARLLERLGIKKPLLAHHAHNEKQSSQGLLKCLEAGESLALVSDAGTPAVSDPGAHVVRIVSQAGFTVVPVPGPSSVLTVVAASGLVDAAFTFRGFLPSKGGQREKALAQWASCEEPQVFFEAPHRIANLLEELIIVLEPDRQLCAGREMTKQFETFYRGSVSEVVDAVRADPHADKGEWAWVLSGKVQEEASEDEMPAISLPMDELAQLMLQTETARTVVDRLVELSGLPKKQVYNLVMSLKK